MSNPESRRFSVDREAWSTFFSYDHEDDETLNAYLKGRLAFLAGTTPDTIKDKLLITINQEDANATLEVYSPIAQDEDDGSVLHVLSLNLDRNTPDAAIKHLHALVDEMSTPQHAHHLEVSIRTTLAKLKRIKRSEIHANDTLVRAASSSDQGPGLSKKDLAGQRHAAFFTPGAERDDSAPSVVPDRPASPPISAVRPPNRIESSRNLVTNAESSNTRRPAGPESVERRPERPGERRQAPKQRQRTEAHPVQTRDNERSERIGILGRVFPTPKHTAALLLPVAVGTATTAVVGLATIDNVAFINELSYKLTGIGPQSMMDGLKLLGCTALPGFLGGGWVGSKLWNWVNSRSHRGNR